MKLTTTLLLIGILSLSTSASNLSNSTTEFRIEKEVTLLIQRCEELKTMNREFNELLHNSSDHQLIMQKRNARLQFKQDLAEDIKTANLSDATTEELNLLNKFKNELGLK